MPANIKEIIEANLATARSIVDDAHAICDCARAVCEEAERIRAEAEKIRRDRREEREALLLQYIDFPGL